jgi:hypothetical protein
MIIDVHALTSPGLTLLALTRTFHCMTCRWLLEQITELSTVPRLQGSATSGNAWWRTQKCSCCTCDDSLRCLIQRTGR